MGGGVFHLYRLIFCISTKINKCFCFLGIDEAGRGPVLGPMVYGVCYSPISLKEEVQNMGLVDSKTTTEQQREDLLQKIHDAKDKIGWIIHVLSPNDISNSMLRRSKYNLNALSHDTAIGMIRKALEMGVNVKEVYVDTVGPADKYQAKLKDLFPDLDITVAPKADSLYTIVSAASICAKVARDRIVKNWTFNEGIDKTDLKYGSGYPSDPDTKSFLANNIDSVFGFPQFVRFSWSTAANILDEKAVPVHWDDDEDVENSKKPNVKSMFKAQTEDPKAKRHIFYTERCLQSVKDL